jgi:hypothetical protein
MAAIGVAKSGTDLDVVQSGADGYVVNHDDGTVRRVSGSTYDADQAVRFADDGSRLQVLVSGRYAYVLDGARGLAHRVDPKSLRELGAPVNIEPDVRAGSALIERSGRLWTVDSSGDLTWSDPTTTGQSTHVRSGAAPAGSATLVAVGDQTVLVAGNRAQWLGQDGQAADSVNLQLRQGEQPLVSGAAQRNSLLVVQPRRGLLEVCTRTACGSESYALPGGHSFGPAAEYQDHYFVPDFTDGSVIVITPGNPATRTAKVLDPTASFVLAPRDTLLFYNDVHSNRAGVIRVDGSHRAISKYDPKKPEAGLDPGTLHASAPQQLEQVTNQGDSQRNDQTSAQPQSRNGPANGPGNGLGNGPGSGPASDGNGGPGTAQQTEFSISAVSFSPNPATEGAKVTVQPRYEGGSAKSCTWKIAATQVPCSSALTAPAAGDFNVVVDAVSEEGVSDSFVGTLTVQPARTADSPTAITSIDYSPRSLKPGDRVSVQVGYDPPGSTPSSCTWRIDSGSSTACGQDATAPGSGSHTISVIAISAQGRQLTLEVPMQVGRIDPPGTPSIDPIPACPQANTDLTLTAQASGQVDSWHWTVSGGASLDEHGASATVHPVEEGSYRAVVYAQNAGGESADAWLNFNVCDKTEPSLSFTGLGGSSEMGEAITVTMSARDDESAITASTLDVVFSVISACQPTEPFPVHRSVSTDDGIERISFDPGRCRGQNNEASVQSVHGSATSSGGTRSEDPPIP